MKLFSFLLSIFVMVSPSLSFDPIPTHSLNMSAQSSMLSSKLESTVSIPLRSEIRMAASTSRAHMIFSRNPSEKLLEETRLLVKAAQRMGCSLTFLAAKSGLDEDQIASFMAGTLTLNKKGVITLKKACESILSLKELLLNLLAANQLADGSALFDHQTIRDAAKAHHFAPELIEGTLTAKEEDITVPSAIIITQSLKTLSENLWQDYHHIKSLSQDDYPNFNQIISRSSVKALNLILSTRPHPLNLESLRLIEQAIDELSEHSMMGENIQELLEQVRRLYAMAKIYSQCLDIQSHHAPLFSFISSTLAQLPDEMAGPATLDHDSHGLFSPSDFLLHLKSNSPEKIASSLGFTFPNEILEHLETKRNGKEGDAAREKMFDKLFVECHRWPALFYLSKCDKALFEANRIALSNFILSYFPRHTYERQLFGAILLTASPLTSFRFFEQCVIPPAQYQTTRRINFPSKSVVFSKKPPQMLAALGDAIVRILTTQNVFDANALPGDMEAYFSKSDQVNSFESNPLFSSILDGISNQFWPLITFRDFYPRQKGDIFESLVALVFLQEEMPAAGLQKALDFFSLSLRYARASSPDKDLLNHCFPDARSESEKNRAIIGYITRIDSDLEGPDFLSETDPTLSPAQRWAIDFLLQLSNETSFSVRSRLIFTNQIYSLTRRSGKVQNDAHLQEDDNPFAPSDLIAIGKRISKFWKKNKKWGIRYGSVAQHIAAAVYSTRFEESEHERMAMHARFLHLTNASLPRARLADWTAGVLLAYHLRSGLHFESDNKSLDAEELVRVTRHFISLLISSRDPIPFPVRARDRAQFSPLASGRHLMLWGLACMLDPTLFDPFFDPNATTTHKMAQPFWQNSDAAKMEYYQRILTKIPLLDGRLALTGEHASTCQIRELIEEVASLSVNDWEALGFESPFRYCAPVPTFLLWGPASLNPDESDKHDGFISIRDPVFKEPAFMFSLPKSKLPPHLQHRLLHANAGRFVTNTSTYDDAVLAREEYARFEMTRLAELILAPQIGTVDFDDDTVRSLESILIAA